MQRTHALLAAVLATATGVASAVASAQSNPPTARAGAAAKVQLRHTSLGSILVSSSGRTLYEFTRDHTATDTCVTLSGCSAAWPALQTRGRPSAGPGVKASLLSTIRLSGGRTQVTYAGHPLYTYSGDSGPGETSYVGESAFGGRWYAINASGHTVK
jgi:predicted lipoprotein with Yx(FWY)xxD motif